MFDATILIVLELRYNKKGCLYVTF